MPRIACDYRFSDSRYVTTASASALFMRYCGMGGRGGSPLGARPVTSNCTALPGSQPSNPAMLGEASAQLGTGTVGAKFSLAPCSHFPRTNSPFSFIGVWQSGQPATPLTRYSPRAICCLLAILPDASRTPSAVARHNAPATIAIIIFFTFFSLSLSVQREKRVRLPHPFSSPQVSEQAYYFWLWLNRLFTSAQFTTFHHSFR